MKTLKEQLIEAIEEINHELNMEGHFYEELYNTSDTYAVRYFSNEIENIAEKLKNDDSSTPLEYLLTLNDIDLYQIIVYKRVAIYELREGYECGYYVESGYMSTVEKLIEKHLKGDTYEDYRRDLEELFFEED